MADISRTFAELIVDFANNITGDVTPQKARNFVESWAQYGGIRMPVSATPGTQSIGTAYVKVNQFTMDAPTSGSAITPDHANDQFTIVKGGVFGILVAMSFSGSNNSTWEGSLFKGAVDMDNTNFKRKLSSAGDVGNVAAFDCVTFADGDVIDYRVKADSSAQNFVLEAGSFFLFRIG